MTLSQERQTLMKTRLAQFDPIFLEITDESDLHKGHPGAQSGAGHFALTMVASQFSNLSLLKRHELIYTALKELLGPEIHALKINARSPQEWHTNPE